PSGEMTVGFMDVVRRIACAVWSSRVASHRYCPSTSSLSPAYPSVRSAGRGHCGRTAAIRCEFLLRLLDPGRVVLLVDHEHRYRHEGVILAAKFGALTVIDAFALRLEPGLVEPAGDCVDLYAERRHRE